MKTIRSLVWDIFIEESMGEEKAQEYVNRILDYSEDMSYITYRNILEEMNEQDIGLDVSFEDVMPEELKQW
tara:strand:- start:46 stop:258 length:213 start_codon:yes stop_codon:yes gene_type:complete